MVGDMASDIADKLAELEGLANLPGILDGAFPFGDRKRDYGAFWTKVRELNQALHSVRLPREVWQPVRARMDTLCGEIKRLQAREREGRESHSRQSKDQILSHLRDARNWVRGARSSGHLGEARKHLQTAMTLLKEHQLLKEDRDECWDLYREVSESIPYRRQEIAGGHYDSLRSDVRHIANLAEYGDPYEALRAIGDLQRKIKAAEITGEQRHHLRDALQGYWDKARQRIEERKRERERKHREWEEKHREWRGRLNEKLERLESARDRKDSFRQRVEEQIEDLEQKIGAARTEAWADRARGWLPGKYATLADVTQGIREIDEKIREVRRKLEE